MIRKNVIHSFIHAHMLFMNQTVIIRIRTSYVLSTSQ